MHNFRKLNLQLFAADGGGTGGSVQGTNTDVSGNTGQNDGTGNSKESNAGDNVKTYSEDDITKLKGYRRGKKAVKTEQRWKRRWRKAKTVKQDRNTWKRQRA